MLVGIQNIRIVCKIPKYTVALSQGELFQNEIKFHRTNYRIQKHKESCVYVCVLHADCVKWLYVVYVCTCKKQVSAEIYASSFTVLYRSSAFSRGRSGCWKMHLQQPRRECTLHAEHLSCSSLH